jgi:hypothetical protein
MSDDLVKRLRDIGYCSPEDVAEAADRIEKLEAALREVISLGEWGVNPLARTVILEALETTCEQLEEGA